MKNASARQAGTANIPRIPVHVSHSARSKAMQLERYAAYSRSAVWGRDEKLLRSNLLHVSGSRTYSVLLAFRRS